MSLSYPFASPPPFEEAIPIAPGLKWLRVFLPISLDHINVWLMEDETGWTAVDTGFGNEKTQATWEKTFGGVMQGRPLSRLIITHYHPDHMGLAKWLCERFDLTVETSFSEWTVGQFFGSCWSESDEENALRYYRQAGVDGDLLDVSLARHRAYRQEVMGVPARFRRLGKNQKVKAGGMDWRVIIGQGHSPEMVCLASESSKILISGDQVLPAMNSSIIMAPFEPEANPLAAYLESLKDFQTLADDTLVLPSHGMPFYGLHERIENLISHHQTRLDRTLGAVSHPASPAEVLDIVFRRKMDTRQLFFALVETLAHLNYLVALGEIDCERNEKGVNLYRRR